MREKRRKFHEHHCQKAKIISHIAWGTSIDKKVMLLGKCFGFQSTKYLMCCDITFNAFTALLSSILSSFAMCLSLFHYLIHYIIELNLMFMFIMSQCLHIAKWYNVHEPTILVLTLNCCYIRSFLSISNIYWIVHNHSFPPLRSLLTSLILIFCSVQFSSFLFSFHLLTLFDMLSPQLNILYFDNKYDLSNRQILDTRMLSFQMILTETVIGGTVHSRFLSD